MRSYSPLPICSPAAQDFRNLGSLEKEYLLGVKSQLCLIRSVCFDTLHLDPTSCIKTKGNVLLIHFKNSRWIQIAILYDKTVVSFYFNCY